MSYRLYALVDMVNLTLYPHREIFSFEGAHRKASIRSRAPRRSCARDLKPLAPLPAPLSVMLQPPLRELALSSSTHELENTSRSTTATTARMRRDLRDRSDAPPPGTRDGASRGLHEGTTEIFRGLRVGD